MKTEHRICVKKMKKPFVKYMNLKLNSKKFMLVSVLFIIFYSLSSLNVHQDTNSSRKLSSKTQGTDLFLNKINQDRLGRLFSKLALVEENYFSSENLSEKLGLISFKQIKEIKEKNSSELEKNDYKKFSYEIKEFLYIDPNYGNIRPSEKFIDYLKNKSEFFSYKKPRIQFRQDPIQTVSRFYSRMQARYSIF